MKYRKLNEVLIEWNESSLEDSDNTFLKSKDIKESFRYFVYKLDKKDQIKIFDADWGGEWPELEKYRDKVLINDKHVELDEGWTVDEFEPGEYKVYIEDIDKLTNTDSMFYKCEQLVSAFIPQGTNQVNSGQFIFGSCSNLKDVSIPSSIIYLDDGVFFNCHHLTGVAIGDSVTSIGKSAFCGCYSLAGVTIPNSVTTIGYRAFEDCSRLTSVTIGDSVTSIGAFVFSRCTSLTSAVIGNSVTEIGRYAFDGCRRLASVAIGDSVTFIGHHAFSGCNKLKTIYVEDINKFNQIKIEDESADPRHYGAKLIELKK